MNVPIRCLAVVSAIAPKLEATFRKAHPRPRRNRHGLPIYPRFRRCYLDPAAQTALMDMALAALQRRGSPFNPATISMGDGDRRILWVLQDASWGFRDPSEAAEADERSMARSAENYHP